MKSSTKYGSSAKDNRSNGNGKHDKTQTSSSSSSSSSQQVLVDRPFEVIVSTQFIVLSVLGCIVGTVLLGCICQTVLMDQLIASGSINMDSAAANAWKQQQHALQNLPKLYYAETKPVPKTMYTSKTFSADSIHASSATVLAEKPNVCTSVKGSQEQCILQSSDETNDIVASSGKNETDAESEEVHEPAGQHLLVDMKNIDEEFLNSETRIAQAMVDIVSVSGLTMLSYHCHELQPTGVSCVGVLLESHISVHTWPIAGVILLDLFTCGPSPLFPLLPLIQQYFGIPRKRNLLLPEDDIENSKPNMLWAHKKRGFKNEKSSDGVQGWDIDTYVVGWLEYEMKQIVASVETEYQTIDIYDTINPRFLEWEQYYAASLSPDKTTYEAQHPQFFQPDRVVFINGVIQSRRYGEAAYHEALVHPAMVVHPNPKRVAIIGGGEGATLREVFKHKSVTAVTMVEIDELMVNVSKQHLPEWSDCSNFKGSVTVPSCFDDPRVTLYIQDATQWFIDRYLDDSKINDDDLFDVIIMDSLDPKDMAEYAEAMLSSDDFMKSIINSLTDDGVFVSQMGEDDQSGEYPDNMVSTLNFIDQIARQDFEGVKVYAEAHCNFYAPWKFAIAFKSELSKRNFYRNQAESDYELHFRGVETLDGSASPFKFFDGATLETYQHASRIQENKFCLSNPTPELCENQHGYDPERKNIPITSLEVQVSQIEGAGRGIFFKEDFVKGSFTSIDEGSHNIMFLPRTTELLQTFMKLGYNSVFKRFDYYLFGYGFSHDYYGGPGFSVDTSIMTFINHGCNGTNNMGVVLPVTEINADLEVMPEQLYYHPVEAAVYNPFIDRNHFIYLNGYDYILGDVKAGEELLDNYLGYLHEGNWKTGVLDYRAQCLEKAKGAIGVYEASDEAVIAEEESSRV